MACSRYEYVKQYEQSDVLLPSCWIVVRLDGRGFTRFCEAHAFDKPNDLRGLHLMNECAKVSSSSSSSNSIDEREREA